ncbi:MAG: family 65 glycosyl hydrolase [Lachnospiraceae bacterium]|nr:family 65 glycosyl hydrolase [Lachnospiraceae bacterium]
MKKYLTRSYTDLTKEENFLSETLFHNANGYIGVRGCLEEGVLGGADTMRGTYINGFYDIIPMKQAEMLCNFVDKKETMLNVADTMTVNCVVDGEILDLLTGRVIKHTRTLDMDKGITKREVIWEAPSGKQIEITSVRMTSFEELSLFSIEYTVKALNFEGDIRIISVHNPDVTNYSDPSDPRLAAESMRNLSVKDIYADGASSIAIAETSVSGLRVCSLVHHAFMAFGGASVKDETTDILGKQGVFTGNARLTKGGSVTLEKICLFTDSVRAREPAGRAVRILDTVLSNGLNYYYKKQEAYLTAFWENCEMEIDGDADMNSAVTFNMYELLQSAAKDSYASIAAKGLSGEGYEGHYFWDTETFILPFFTLTNPALSKMLLRYRYSTLEKARENAGLLGHQKGALFPWRTITGTECSGYFVSGSAAYHINADIAYAYVNYYITTGDLDFMREAGMEVLLETSRLWTDLGCYNENGDFVLNVVTGPDEYTCMVNNNYYTNVAAKYNLCWTLKIHRLLKEAGMLGNLDERLGITDEELASFGKAAEAMLLPYDARLGINPQDDSFLSKPVWDLTKTPKDHFPLLLHYHPLHLYRYQVCKQADTVLSYFMFENEQPRDVMMKSYEYYEKITTHDSSLSTCVFSIVASRLGMKEKAYAYFGDSAKLDLLNTHSNSMHGIHTANMGGCYMAIVNGFAGLRVTEEGISLSPSLPKDWNGYKFKFVYRDRRLKVAIDQDAVTVELLTGDDLTIRIFGKQVELTKKQEKRIQMEE